MTENIVIEENENENNENIEIEEPEGVEIWRLTTLKANGSVWTKTYNDVHEVGEAIYELAYKFPHVILSRQTLKISPEDYKMKVESNGGQKS